MSRIGLATVVLTGILSGLLILTESGLNPQMAIATPSAITQMQPSLHNQTRQLSVQVYADPITIALRNADFSMPSDSLMTNLDHALVDMPADYYNDRSIRQLKQQIQDGSVFLIDVRKPGEYDSGHIDDAINIPLHELTRNLDRVPSDRTVVVYCSTGYRAGMGVLSLHLLGYDNVRGFSPGYEGWKQAQDD